MQLEQVRVTLAKGDIHDVALTNRSQIAFDKEAALRKWPDSDVLSRTFQAWWELAKMTKTLECTFDDFSTNLCMEVAPYVTAARLAEMVKADKMPEFVADELRADGLVIEAVDVDPTQLAPQPESPST